MLEDHFVVCWWEQRGSGLLFSTDLANQSLTHEQIVSDALAVTDYLRRRFGKDRVSLMAHSAGTFFGIQVAARAPERFHAYIGVAQISRQLDWEKLAYTYMFERFTAAGNRNTAKTLDAIPLLTMHVMPRAYNAVRDNAMHSLGIGTTHAMKSVLRGIFLPVMHSRAYTLRSCALFHDVVRN